MKEDWLIMSKKERQRKMILEAVCRGKVKLVDVTPKLGVGYRQAKRMKAAYIALGSKGLVHGNRGKPSGHRYAKEFKDQVLQLYAEKYFGFGPTFAAEKLEEHDGIVIHPETLRGWLLEAKLWRRQRKRKRCHKRRDPKKHFGELLQIDGSHHQWFGKRTARSCLLNIVDDASSTSLSQLAKEETSEILLKTFRLWVERYGVPKAVYVDLKNIYISPGRSKDGERIKVPNAFERACALLRVKIIPAYSPQAKGRVERSHGIYQDRFVKELKLRGIKEIAEANEYLLESYLDEANKRFARAPACQKDVHVPAKVYGDLDQIFCWEYTRQVKNDATLQFEGKYYQLENPRARSIYPKDTVQIRKHLDGQLSLWKEGVRLKYRELVSREPVKVSQRAAVDASRVGRQNSQNSPWRQYNPRWLKQRKKTDLSKRGLF